MDKLNDIKNSKLKLSIFILILVAIAGLITATNIGSGLAALTQSPVQAYSDEYAIKANSLKNTINPSEIIAASTPVQESSGSSSVSSSGSSGSSYSSNAGTKKYNPPTVYPTTFPKPVNPIPPNHPI